MALPAPAVPYGAWPSPLAAADISAAQRKLGEIRWHGPTNLALWVESRPAEAGRYVLCTGQPKRNLIPAEMSVRTRVHEYGGGAWTVVGDGVVFANFSDQRLYLVPLGAREGGGVEATGPPEPLTSAEEQGDACRVRYAAMVEVEVHGLAWLVCVREVHGEGREVENQIAALPLAGPRRGQASPVLRGYDFYSHPSVFVDKASGAARLACVAWNHPNMPWDDTDLLLLRDLQVALKPDGTVTDPTTFFEVLVSSAEQAQSIVEPRFDPRGRLFFYSDRSDKYNLFHFPSLEAGAVPAPAVVLASDKDLIGSSSLWIMGTQTYGFFADGRLALAVPREGSRPASIAVLDPETFEANYVSAGLPDRIGQVVASPDGCILLSGGGCQSPDQVFSWTPQQDPAVRALASCVDEADQVESAWIPIPEMITFPTTLHGEDTEAYAWYYPPTNPNVSRAAAAVDTGAAVPAPPLLVKAHGGPHGAAGLGYRLDLAFWTSRGWAVIDVNYGGSMGYGRAYRQRLTHPEPSWGIVDIADVTAAAAFCVAAGKAREGACAIEGGSAGGYTTLAALVFGRSFQAGCSMYGVSDLSLLAADTHKFESRYLDRLIGPYPEAQAIYDARSPLKHCERLAAPLLLLQGDEDKIVPPNQAEKMYEVLLEKKLPTALVIFQGEQHGFRKQENIQACLNGKLYFFSKVFGLAPPDNLGEPFVIQNLA